MAALQPLSGDWESRFAPSNTHSSGFSRPANFRDHDFLYLRGCGRYRVFLRVNV